ncbi:MAG TPA: hypothetical protein PKC79_02270 [Solidesulfovibrio magneticus]|nr:hypothetical protein [Solidesulfovibrio magneticus]
MQSARRLNLLDLPSLNLDADIATSMNRIVESSGLSRAEAVDRLNEAARRYGVRLCGGNAEALTLAAFEKWLNPNESKNVPSTRALNLFVHVFGTPEPLDLLARSHGQGWRVIDGEDARLLEWARTEQEIKRLKARKRKIEAKL